MMRKIIDGPNLICFAPTVTLFPSIRGHINHNNRVILYASNGG